MVDGRRWRATDPSIPPTLRQELVDGLMAARRSVAAARRAESTDEETVARQGVGLAKVALGERGEPWWEPSPHGQRARLRATILVLVRHRGAAKTICPSDAARAVGGDQWRALVPVARDEARELAHDGVVQVTQGGDVVDPEAEWHGPVRIGLPTG